MKLNMNSQQTRMILYVVIAFLVWKCWSSKNTSGHTLSMSPIEIIPVSTCDPTKGEYKMECVPGPEPNASPYTKDLTPGGICGAQECVADNANYTIIGGIGMDEPAPAGNIISTGN